jgi:hypothetical protein
MRLNSWKGGDEVIDLRKSRGGGEYEKDDSDDGLHGGCPLLSEALWKENPTKTAQNKGNSCQSR